MKTIEIHAQERLSFGTKSARELVRSGFIPAVLYGGNKEKPILVHLSIPAVEVRPLDYETCFVDLHVGKQKHRCILQKKDVHPVSNIPIHMDFLAVFKDKPITMQIPLNLVGKSVGVTKGGLLVKKLRKIQVKALPKQMPEKVSLDVSHLDLGQTSKVREIQAGEYTILNSPAIPVAVVEIPRALRSKANQEVEKK